MGGVGPFCATPVAVPEAWPWTCGGLQGGLEQGPGGPRPQAAASGAPHPQRARSQANQTQEHPERGPRSRADGLQEARERGSSSDEVAQDSSRHREAPRLKTQELTRGPIHRRLGRHRR